MMFLNMNNKLKLKLLVFVGDWGLGIGDWGLVPRGRVVRIAIGKILPSVRMRKRAPQRRSVAILAQSGAKGKSPAAKPGGKGRFA